jgi:hypothetical protein
MTLPVDLQQSMLESEGIKFDRSGRCDVNAVLWFPDDWQKPAETVTLFGSE